MRWPAGSARPATLLAAAALLTGCGDGDDDPRSAGTGTTPPPVTIAEPVPPSRALGTPNDGRLVHGLQLPEQGPYHLTWDPIRHEAPNRPGRRWGTDRLLTVLLNVLERFRAMHPDAPRVLVGDLSRPDGGDFGRQYGGLGHASHQNGLDVDVFYPRRDRTERAPRRVRDVDRARAQDLVDLFVEAGVQFAFVGTEIRPDGPPSVVQSIPHHNDHIHVRIRPPAR